MLNPNCTRCELHKRAVHVCIGGRGSETPKVLFVGQNPGQDEDKANKAFIGKAGKLLAQMVEKYGVKDCRITNAVKCVTPEDREPDKVEIRACRGYLEWEIGQYKPKLIVALGNTALESLCGRVGISSSSGQLAGDYGKIPVFALYHPAYVLRSPSNMGEWGKHWEALSSMLNGGSPKNPLEMMKRNFPDAKIERTNGEEWISSKDFNLGARFAEVIMADTLAKVKSHLDGRIDKIEHDLKLMQKRALTKIKEEVKENGH